MRTGADRVMRHGRAECNTARIATKPAPGDPAPARVLVPHGCFSITARAFAARPAAGNQLPSQ